MAVRVVCPSCSIALSLLDESADRMVKCPRCSATIQVARTVTAPPSPSGPSAPPGSVGSVLAPPQLPDEVGRLGPYRILGELGAGGMGVVFRAEDTALNRAVAVKVMLPQFAADPTAKARFIREAQAQARVEHEHVVSVHQVAEHAGVPYIVMPLLKGQTLAAALKEDPRPPLPELVRVGREIAEGLAAAHAAGLIHRDIKPSNVWLEGPNRRVRILDFGLARSAARSDAGDALTHTGAVLGTPAYMSPEQARGQRVSHHTDLFSLGVVLYQMATGDPPFSGESVFDVLTAVVGHDPAPVHKVAPDRPAALSRLIARLLAKDPAERPADALTVATELAAVERGTERVEGKSKPKIEARPVEDEAGGGGDRAPGPRQRPRPKRRGKDDEGANDRDHGRGTEPKRKSKFALILAIVAGSVLLPCCGGAGWFVYLVVDGVRDLRQAQDRYDRLKVGDTRTRAEEAAGRGQVATAADVQATVGTNSAHISVWTEKANQGRVLIWRSGGYYVLAAFHPSAEGTGRLQMKEWGSSTGVQKSEGELDDARFSARYK